MSEGALEADLIGDEDEEECLLRDHLLAIHPTVQPRRSPCC